MLLDMMHRIESSSRVYVLDTGRLHQATYDLIDRVRDRYDKDVEVVFPEAEAVQGMVREHGMNLFYESLEKRKLCCRLRKVEPNQRYLAELDAHVTGLRREQNVTRADAPEDRGREERPREDQPARRLERRRRVELRAQALGADEPPAQKRGSLPLAAGPCTRAIQPGDDVRAGRWWWENADTKELAACTSTKRPTARASSPRAAR